MEIPRLRGEALNIPKDVYELFDKESDNIEFGTATLEVHFQNGRPRFDIGKKVSMFSEEYPPDKKAGRGHVDEEQIEKVKELMRALHPKGVRRSDIAECLKCNTAKVERVMDVLSSGMDFLVSMDDERPPHYFISKDVEKEKAVQGGINDPKI